MEGAYHSEDGTASASGQGIVLLEHTLTTDAERRAMPQEMVDHITDFLWDNPQALQQLSLVCRAWLPGASRHLFSRFSWPPCGHIWPWKTGCRCSPHDRAVAWQELLDFCMRPRVRHNVRALTLSFFLSVSSSYYNHSPTSVAPLLDLLSALPDLRSLDLWRMNLPLDSLPLEQASYLRTLHNLVVRPSTPVLSSADPIIALLEQFESIHTLEIDGSEGAGLTESRYEGPRKWLRATSLKLTTLSSKQLASTLNLLKTLIDSKALAMLDIRDTKGFGLLEFTCPLSNLRRLIVDCEVVSELPSPPPTLRELVIYAGTRDSDRISWSTALGFLSHTPVVGMSVTLHFRLRFPRPTPRRKVSVDKAEDDLEDVAEHLRGRLAELDWALLNKVVEIYSTLTLRFQLLDGTISRRDERHSWRVVDDVMEENLHGDVKEAIHPEICGSRFFLNLCLAAWYLLSSFQVPRRRHVQHASTKLLLHWRAKTASRY